MVLNENIPSTQDTYEVSISAFTPAATPTDIVSIVGGAGKTVKILKIEISNVQTTAGVNDFFLIKRSALDTSVTATTLVPVPLDSRSPAAVATVLKHTANAGGLGAAAGTLRATKISAGTPTNSTNPVYLFDYNDTNGSPIVLRGANENLAINFAGAAVPAGFVCDINVTLIEQAIQAS